MSQITTDTVPSTELSEVDMAMLAKTRSSGISFIPPETHDMVRSLFDPTIKKSFLELCITSALLLNFVFAYYSVQWFGRSFTRKLYILQYVFWRLCYNGGIGIVLHYQSHYETLTKWAKKTQIFNKKNSSLLARFLQFEVGAKLPSKNKVYEYPPELTTWLLFRQFVDLILMQDFDTYIIFVFLSLPDTNLNVLFNWKSVLGIVLIFFNVWVKLDAHRVVKDFAWYWGDFFFLQTNSQLVFDGVFNISPHPMYSIGYLGYYGLSLITGDYQVLLVSILGHFLQFLFLKYVETPHIDRTYGQANDNNDSNTPASIDDLIAKENFDYSRPLISTGIWLNNFNKLRISDYFTVTTVLTIITWYITYKPSCLTLFILTFSIKFFEWIIVSTILYKQSEDKWFTKLFMKNGYTQLYSFQQWQFIYNFSLVISYTLLTIQTINNVHMIPFKEESYTQLIFGLLLCALQVWCDTEIRDAISDFGWFYGDFFLSNYITSRKLTSEGIYRYLNNPEAILGVAGIWGTVLMTNFAKDNIILASLWTFSNFMLVKFVETPHMEKLYGNEQRISGVGKTLLSLKPLKRVSEIVDNIEHIIMRSILNNNENHPVVTTTTTSSQITKDHDDFNKRTNNAKDWENVIENAIKNVTSRLTPNCEFELNLANDEEACSVVPDPIEIDWKLPTDLYDDNDWIGLYNVISTRNNREFTRVPSFGHWVHTKDHVVERTDEFIRGKIIFDASLLNYEVGIYEFRYHSKDTHKVLMISTPFQVRLPELDTSTEIALRESLLAFLQAAQVIKDGKFFDYDNGNKYFNIKSLQRVIKNSIGVELSNEYIRKVNGDVDVMANRIWDIKKILDDLE
ncbi:similar to Saccharomyces cerevisiae YGR157W CHO2 Phosphatidylethanolamine methyltransferase (PEMT) [Maudiozyma saulgeensis]|uniref:Phosphatidylethanolamine N-methyltransferase n=1 Tax=Maudiozyma saulgeensis TaxID=1789683 RepID=A0A1X7R670_9SACH|nr:similar to Saccharomyces cerevisiae YGR157W CHO2 Phosphatidylethanolamine methyltransferase (PEMT) [Kazachstania saulgeensis]